MAPAAHHIHRRQHHHSHQNAVLATHVEHRGQHDVISVYEIGVPSTSSCSGSSSSSLSPLPRAPTFHSAAYEAPSSPTPSSTRAFQTTTSQYPKPSPPTFLYPQPIAPPHVYTMQRDERDHGPAVPHSDFVRSGQDQTWIMPGWLTIFIVAALAVAVAWTVLVCAVHYRGATTGMSPKSNSTNTRNKLWARIIGNWSPFVKRGRYTALREESSASEPTRALTSAHNVSGSAQLEYRSPVNPYLVPPDQPLDRSGGVRSSGEWAEQHRAFFLHGTAGSPKSSTAMSRMASSTYSLEEAELDDVEAEAREAQGRRPSLGRNLGLRDGRGEGGMSWVDLGLAMVDGAVDRAAARIVRWADDNGGNEALVLPIAKGKTE